MATRRAHTPQPQVQVLSALQLNEGYGRSDRVLCNI